MPGIPNNRYRFRPFLLTLDSSVSENDMRGFDIIDKYLLDT
jgi:hypothetical protein